MMLLKIKLAQQEAIKFLLKINILETKMGINAFKESENHIVCDFPKETEEIRKASLYLMQSLSEMRKS